MRDDNMSAETRQLYLDLMKKALTYTLWPEPPIPLMQSDYGRHAISRAMVSILSKVFGVMGIELCRERNFTERHRAKGHIWPAYAHTMIGIRRLENLQQCIEVVLDEHLEGDLIEAGVWRGGACIFLRAVLA
ncbi:MAG: macrocin-O-methyltransferase, partial [Armatimonadota bacterium]